MGLEPARTCDLGPQRVDPGNQVGGVLAEHVNRQCRAGTGFRQSPPVARRLDDQSLRERTGAQDPEVDRSVPDPGKTAGRLPEQPLGDVLGLVEEIDVGTDAGSVPILYEDPPPQRRAQREVADPNQAGRHRRRRLNRS